jgi:hypothetical protein
VQAIQAVLCKGLNPSPSCGYTVGDSLLRTSSPRQVQWESLGLAESTEEQWKTCHFLGTHVVSLSVARLIWTMRTSKGCLLSLCTLPFSYAHDSPQIHHRFTTDSPRCFADPRHIKARRRVPSIWVWYCVACGQGLTV